MHPILMLGAVLVGPQLIDRLRASPAAAKTPAADPFGDLFVWHVRQAGEALVQAQHGGGLVAVGVARGHIEGARQIFSRLPAARRSQAASAVQHAQELVQRVQAQLARPVAVAPLTPRAEDEGGGAAPAGEPSSNVLQYTQR